MKKKTLKLFLGLIVIVSIISMWTVSAGFFTLNLNSNETNGSTWYKGGTTRMFNFTVLVTGLNTTTNLTQINFSMSNFTLVANGNNVTVASAASSVWTCTNNTVNTLVNCTGQAAQPGFAINVTINVTLPSTATQINQTWNISTSDNVSGVLNLTAWNTEVDNVAPTITLPLYTNATAKTNGSSSLTLNISVSDGTGSGLTGSACIVTNGTTNQTLTLSSGWCNSTSINLTGISQGKSTLLVYANDTVNNLALNNSFYVFMDSLAPTVSATCSPSSLPAGQAFPCSCSSSDPAGGTLTTSSSSTSGSTTSTAGQSGTFTYSCSATNLAGVSGSATATYIVLGSAGGGTSSSTSSPITTTNTPATNSTTNNLTGTSTNQNNSVNSTTNVNQSPPQSNNLLVNLWNAFIQWLSHLFNRNP